MHTHRQLGNWDPIEAHTFIPTIQKSETGGLLQVQWQSDEWCYKSLAELI